MFTLNIKKGLARIDVTQVAETENKLQQFYMNYNI